MDDSRAASRVYFDGGCPVCRREIGWYQGMRGGREIEWIDIAPDTVDQTLLPPQSTREDLLRRFTITRADGETVSGGPGFISLWRALPALRWLGLAADHWAGRWVAERAYRVFLRIRALWR